MIERAIDASGVAGGVDAAGLRILARGAESGGPGATRSRAREYRVAASGRGADANPSTAAPIRGSGAVVPVVSHVAGLAKPRRDRATAHRRPIASHRSVPTRRGWSPRPAGGAVQPARGEALPRRASGEEGDLAGVAGSADRYLPSPCEAKASTASSTASRRLPTLATGIRYAHQPTTSVVSTRRARRTRLCRRSAARSWSGRIVVQVMGDARPSTALRPKLFSDPGSETRLPVPVWSRA